MLTTGGVLIKASQNTCNNCFNKDKSSIAGSTLTSMFSSHGLRECSPALPSSTFQISRYSDRFVRKH